MRIKRPKSNQPIPKHARKVFKGVIFDTYQWKQKLYDGSFRTFEKIRRVDSVGVMPITKEGKVILTQQQQPRIKPFVGIVGGMIDPGETPLQAAQRELIEETGYKAKKFELWFSVQPLEKVEWTCFNFVAKDLVKVHPVRNSRKKSEFSSKVSQAVTLASNRRDIVSNGTGSIHKDQGEKIKLLEVDFGEFVDVFTGKRCRDFEIALYLFRALRDKKEFQRTKKLFSVR